MLIRADFSVRAVVTPDDYQWSPAPQPGVERVMLDRKGDEKARATSLVSYAPGSVFPSHPHPGGEEILVLDGTFSDADGDYPAGWYLRNPPGSQHAPFSAAGTLLFVKLWQMPESERRAVRVDTRIASLWVTQGQRLICPLFKSGDEHVSLQKLSPTARVLTGPVDGAEILVLAGDVREGDLRYATGSWLRLPAGDYSALVAGDGGATIYLKAGPLGRGPTLTEAA
jgi:anti-sigma factor ChrR (cupin superfamily)